MGQEIQNRIVGVVGRKGAGKSTYIRSHLGVCPRVFLFDVMAEYDSIPNRLETISGVERFFQWAKDRDTWACRFVPGGDLEEAIEQICPLVYRQGSCLFVCEEIALYTRPGSVTAEFGKLIRTGRHKEISVVWATQRPAECAKSITALTDLWILFSITEPRDLDAIADRCGAEIANRVSALGQHEFIIWDVMARELIEDSPRMFMLDEVRPAPASRRRERGMVILRRKKI